MSSINAEPEKMVINKSRKSLLLVLLTFALPIILAKMALEQEWLDLGVTNQGELLNNELTLEQLGLGELDFDKQWLILYSMPTDCQDQCLKTLETVHNSYVALGKDMPRVTPVALKQSDFTQQKRQQLAKSQWQIVSMPTQVKNIVEKPQVFIVDPLGNIILSHQPPLAEHQQQAKFGKSILADMKKLLKYSKVG
jgi:hypothetical protein